MDPTRGPWPGRMLALTIGLGAFLLFLVQPLLGKGMLPRFGGGPAVWTTCLLFFQTVLFAGYAWAYASERFLSGGLRTAVHLGLAAAAVALLPIVPGGAGEPADPDRPVGQILRLLVIQVGAPGFLLAATGPLVQSWFSRAHPGRSPYRLYALSNAGSLAALAAYPFVFEPMWGLRMQAAIWTWAFLAYALLFAAGAIADRRSGPSAAPASGGDDPPPSVRRAAPWFILSAYTSAMLLTTTQQLGHDLAVIPFLWILPLAAYLLSFILAFERPGAYVPRALAPVTAVLVLLTAVLHAFHGTHARLFSPGILVTLAALFCLCLLGHGELARRKPAPGRLTVFYLAIAGGGAAGSAFVALLAPQIFATLLEWKLGMALAYVAAWGVLAGTCRGRLRAHRNRTAALLVVAGIGLAVIVACFGSQVRRVEVVRNFHGVVAVEDRPGRRDLVNGGVLHGRQFTGEDLRRRPTAYFAETSGVGRVLEFFRSRDDLRVGVVGLGVGTIAAYATSPAQSFRFYEINPEVTRLARTQFTFLKDCPARVDVVTGDARLSLEREPPRGFHVLALDAFTGGAIPVHLLTGEATAVWLRHLDADGVIAVHVSHPLLDLAPVVRGAARRFGLTTLLVDDAAAGNELARSSTWILCTRNEAAVRALTPYAAKDGDAREILWTDDFSDLLSVVKWR